MSNETIILRDVPKEFAYLVVLSGPRVGRTIHLAKEVTLGRAGENDVCIDDPAVSAHHAKIRREESTYVLYDLASENGTRVESQKVHRQELQSGNHISVGDELYMFKLLRIPRERRDE